MMLALLPLGAVKLPAWFSDNMVLQTDTENGERSFLSGLAAPNEAVHITGGAGSYSVAADGDGAWKATLDPQHVTGKPFSITISGADGPSVTANNVLVGDVFFCSGQSNMVYPLHLAFNATAEAATISNHPNFRFFMTERSTSPTPLFDFSGSGTCDSSYVNKSLSACNRWLTAAEAAGDYVEAFSAVCYMTVRDIAKLHTGDRPIALIQSAWGGTRVEAWMAAADIAAAGAPVTGNVPHGSGPNEQSVLYNAMVAPWDPFSIRAMLWYQGEANANELTNHNQSISYYANAYQAMIAGWRERKGVGDFAVLTVQLPPSVNSSMAASNPITGRPEIRIAEMEAAAHAGGATDNSGTAVTLDLGGSSAWGVDHPPNKNEIARRLALQALYVTYALQTWTYSGPVLETAEVSTGTIVLKFAGWSAGGGLALRDVKAANIDGSRNDCVQCCAKAPPFELSADGGKTWRRVSRAATDVVPYRTVKLTLAPSATVPTHVRYAWADYVDCVLENGDGLVSTPFSESLA